MTARLAAVVAMRIFGLFVVVRGLDGLFRSLEHLVEISDLGLTMMIRMNMFSALLMIGVGVLVWAIGPRLADIALRAGGDTSADPADVDSGKVQVRVTALEAQDVGLVILGAFLLSMSFVQLTAAAAEWVRSVTTPPPDFGPGAADFASVVIRNNLLLGLGYLVAGLVVALGASAVGDVFRRVRLSSRGFVRARRLDVVDAAEGVRASLAIEEGPEGREDVALTLFDPDGEPTLRLPALSEDPGKTVP